MSANAVHVIRFGLIKCEIFARHTRTGTRFVVTATRLYRNGQQWQESKQFFREDLLVLAKALDLAHTWIYAHGESHAAAQAQTTEQPDRSQ
jgi:hypothetical protein